jgi:hypothetical protein
MPAANRVACFSDFSAASATPDTLLSLSVGGGTQPVAVAFDPPSVTDTQDRLFVAMTGQRSIHEYLFNATRTSLTFVRSIDVSSEVTGAQQMGDLVVAPVTENLILAHSSSGRILRVAQATGAITVVASGFSAPVGLAFDGADLLVVDESLSAVFRISPNPAAPGTF